jgi:hypothetical protein
VEEIGQPAKALIAAPGVRAEPASSALIWGALAILSAAAGALLVWSFTVDDALISVRYARHLASGVGYRMNAGGPVTDGVTPLAWPFVLWPLARGAPLVVLGRAKALGLGLSLASAAVLGAAVGWSRAPLEGKIAALLGLLVCLPFAAYSVSGMETPVATLLATLAAVMARRVRLTSLLAGLAASLRPELVPWALTLALFVAASDRDRRQARVLLAVALALAPFLACCVAREMVFGRPAPLAVMAKPSDLVHGLSYAVAASLVAVGPVMALSPIGAWRERGAARALTAAGVAHLGAIVAVGGDWMPFARLVVPVVPSLLFASVLLWEGAHPWVPRVRTLLALLLGVRAFASMAPVARRVGPDREALVGRAEPLLARRERIASVDVGWVSAATEADVVDLAGVTDPEVAALGGGHTSKRIDASFLLGRHADTLLLYGKRADRSQRPEGVDRDVSTIDRERWTEAEFPRVTEARLARSELVARDFVPAAFVPLNDAGFGYFVLYRR